MKFVRYFASICIALTLATAARADSINFNTTLTTADTTQLGRPSRNAIPQDWTGSEAYPGVINGATTYYYKTFSFASTLFAGGPYLQIESYEPNNFSTPAYFLSAYAGSYDPSNRAANWLGDEGSSGDSFFQIILPSYTPLVLVVNSTQGGTLGLGTLFNINIENFSSTSFDPPVVTPEPSSLVMVGTGLVSAFGMVRRRFKTA